LHTLELPLKNRTSDEGIIQFVVGQKRVVITKDIDFLNSHVLKSMPEKLILVKAGNIQNKQLINI
jgi:predicted nuclease of predicted toxin-antitoxin system